MNRNKKNLSTFSTTTIPILIISISGLPPTNRIYSFILLVSVYWSDEVSVCFLDFYI